MVLRGKNKQPLFYFQLQILPSGLIRFDIQGFFCYDMEKDIILSRRVFYETIKRVLLY